MAVGRVIVLSHWPHVAKQVAQQVAELVAQLVSETFHIGHMCGNKLRASAASSIFRRHEGGSLCCGIPRLQPTNQKMEFLMTSYSVRCCYWAQPTAQ